MVGKKLETLIIISKCTLETGQCFHLFSNTVSYFTPIFQEGVAGVRLWPKHQMPFSLADCRKATSQFSTVSSCRRAAYQNSLLLWVPIVKTSICITACYFPQVPMLGYVLSRGWLARLGQRKSVFEETKNKISLPKHLITKDLPHLNQFPALSQGHQHPAISKIKAILRQHINVEIGYASIFPVTVFVRSPTHETFPKESHCPCYLFSIDDLYFIILYIQLLALLNNYPLSTVALLGKPLQPLPSALKCYMCNGWGSGLRNGGIIAARVY